MDFFRLWHTSNEYISGEKALLTFLSNLSRYFLGLHGVIHMRTLVRKCEQHKTSKGGLITSRQGYKNQEKGVNFYNNVNFGVICTELGPRKWYFLARGYLSCPCSYISTHDTCGLYVFGGRGRTRTFKFFFNFWHT